MPVRGRSRHRLIAIAFFAATVAPFSQVTPAHGNAESLRQQAERAADSLRRRQNPWGYWDTAVTPSMDFRSPTFEVNVFTPSVIVDLLEPIADETGLNDVVENARAYLRRQIEATGLVRYHGDPGTGGNLPHGCELPPDSDDTALVWRIAPRNEGELLAAARKTLQENRDAGGLYRTWIADPNEYRCFYDKFFPRDSNPPDVCIQMHVYLFLAKHDPAAARALCAALQKRIADDRLWVWYARTPLLPLLREADLARAGCSVKVPESRLAQMSTKQLGYINAARLLIDLSTGTDRLPSPAATLESLAAGGFAALKDEPPLLYHNALSAEPPHYHWSEDVGYALWLRLLVESERRSPQTSSSSSAAR